MNMKKTRIDGDPEAAACEQCLSSLPGDWEGCNAISPRAGLSAVAAIVLVFLATGCIGITGPRTLAQAVERENGVRLNPVVAFDVGGMLVGTAMTVASTQSGIDLQRGRIDWVEVGVYEIDPGETDVRSVRLLDRVEIDGWTACTKVRDGNEEVKVLVRVEEPQLTGLAVLVRDGSEMVIVRVRGDLGPLAEEAIRMALEQEGLNEGRRMLEEATADGAEQTALVSQGLPPLPLRAM
jgi:hypothetical protein